MQGTMYLVIWFLNHQKQDRLYAVLFACFWCLFYQIPPKATRCLKLWPDQYSDIKYNSPWACIFSLYSLYLPPTERIYTAKGGNNIVAGKLATRKSDDMEEDIKEILISKIRKELKYVVGRVVGNRFQTNLSTTITLSGMYEKVHK